MDKDQLAKMVADKIDAALKNSEHPKKFFITANGRGVTDGGDLYNALLNDVLGVVSTALVDIFQELAAVSSAKAAAAAEKSAASAKASDKPAAAAKVLEKTAKSSGKK